MSCRLPLACSIALNLQKKGEGTRRGVVSLTAPERGISWETGNRNRRSRRPMLSASPSVVARAHNHRYQTCSVVSRVMRESQGRSFRYSAIHSEAVPPDQKLPPTVDEGAPIHG